jgi:uncharacterized protein (DUF849 family)
LLIFAEYIEPDLSRRLAWIEAWTILPDFVSVNLSESDIDQVISVLVKKKVGLEAGIWSAADAQYLMTLREVPWQRLLLEPWETDPKQANLVVDEIEDILGDALPNVPRLIHGTNGAAWSLLERAARSGHVSRIGFEDTLKLPDGEIPADNAALVRAAKSLAQPR